MEGDFKKLLTLSPRHRPESRHALPEAHDALQQIQARIREFEEMGKVVKTGVERLDKKQEIISVTAEGVDKNFQRLGRRAWRRRSRKPARRRHPWRQRSGPSRPSTRHFPDERRTRRPSWRNAREAHRRHRRAGAAAGKGPELARVDGADGDEVRGDRPPGAGAGTAPARALSRRKQRRKRGIAAPPPMDKRETVVKLSHQGWSVQEISRVTQLSRGEVELILELAPKV